MTTALIVTGLAVLAALIVIFGPRHQGQHAHKLTPDVPRPGRPTVSAAEGAKPVNAAAEPGHPYPLPSGAWQPRVHIPPACMVPGCGSYGHSTQQHLAYTPAAQPVTVSDWYTQLLDAERSGHQSNTDLLAAIVTRAGAA